MQLYKVTVRINLRETEEINDVVLCASNADQAAVAACVHCRIAPSLADVEVHRVKGNAFITDQRTRKMFSRAETDKAQGQQGHQGGLDSIIRDAEEIQTSTAHRPKLSRRVVEMRATIYSRTDDSAFVGVGKALIECGKRGTWKSDFVVVEDLKCKEDEQRKPNNPRVEKNAQYIGASVYRN